MLVLLLIASYYLHAKTACQPNTVQALHVVIIDDVGHDYVLRGAEITPTKRKKPWCHI
uniref:Uncharacterized protein n=1 Tax=Setaria viridis TaxID=4556 RepID=A0A4U6VTY8_SETVI|nr:hypothetical protein SEVIR_2G168901v2 [Setaria viridis]